MKIQMLLAALFISLISFSQPGEHFLSYRDGYRTAGFVDGQKLDTLPAQYATLGWNANGQVFFDYGQYRDGKKEILIKDSEGKTFVFEEKNIPFLLNFLFHNGWEVQQIVSNAGGSIASQDTYLLKKRRS